MAHFHWDIIILAVIAFCLGAIFFRVLGRKIGTQTPQHHHAMMSRVEEAVHRQHETKGGLQPPPLPGNIEAASEQTEYVVPAASTSLGHDLMKVAAHVPDFQGERFLRETGEVFEKVLKAFAHDERSVLEKHVTPGLMTVFGSALDHRRAEAQQLQCTLERIERLEIQGVRSPEEGQVSTFRVMVGVTSWQVRYLKDKHGVIIDGTEARTEFSDLWGMEYHDGQWRLAETALA